MRFSHRGTEKKKRFYNILLHETNRVTDGIVYHDTSKYLSIKLELGDEGLMLYNELR